MSDRDLKIVERIWPYLSAAELYWPYQQLVVDVVRASCCARRRKCHKWTRPVVNTSPMVCCETSQSNCDCPTSRSVASHRIALPAYNDPQRLTVHSPTLANYWGMHRPIITTSEIRMLRYSCRWHLILQASTGHLPIFFTLHNLYSICYVPTHDFYPRDAMLARVIEIATCLSVRLSVCPSVCPSRAGIVSKRRKLAAWFLHHLVAPRL